MVARKHQRRILIAAAQGALAALTLGCTQYSYNERLDNLDLPTFGVKGAEFKPVSAVLERRCGNQDCHGSPFRALKIYGKFGFRRPEVMGTPNIPKEQFPFYYPGGIPTTDAEIADNYDSVVSLEPLLMSEVWTQQDRATAELPCPYTADNNPKMTPDCLTLVRKPRREEKHKGGTIWKTGSPADRCLVGWITKDPLYVTEGCDKDLADAQ